MICESSLITNRVGDNGDSLGLFQIQWEPSTWVGWKSYPQMKYLRNRNIYEPVTNAQAAFISTIVGAGAAFFGLYVGKAGAPLPKGRK